MITIDEVMNLAKETKESMDWDDLQPMLHMFHDDGTQTIALIVGFTTGPPLWSALYTIVKAAGNVWGVMFLADARMRTVERGEWRPPNDNLQEKWEAGERDGITECLIVTYVTKDGKAKVSSLPYDAEKREWGEVDTHDGDMSESGIIGALQLAFREG